MNCCQFHNTHTYIQCLLALLGKRKGRKKTKGQVQGLKKMVVYAMGMVGCTGIPVVSKGTVEVI